MAIFKGAGVAIVTPMYEDGKVNYGQVPPHHPLPLQQRADGQRGTLLLHQ